VGQKAKTVNTVSGDVVAEAEKRGAVTKGPDLSFLAGLEEAEGEVGAPLVELMAELSPGPRVSILGALHPSTYQARGLPMATRPRGQTRDTLRLAPRLVLSSPSPPDLAPSVTGCLLLPHTTDLPQEPLQYSGPPAGPPLRTPRLPPPATTSSWP